MATLNQPNMEQEPFKGGQGRSGSSVENDGKGMLAVVGICLALLISIACYALLARCCGLI